MTLPIRLRLSVVNVLLLAAILIALGAFLVLRLHSDLRSTIDDDVQGSSATIVSNYAGEGVRGFREISRDVLPGAGTASQILEPDGGVVVAYGGAVADAPMVSSRVRASALAGHATLHDAELGRSHQRFRVLARAVRHKGHRQVVVVAKSLGDVDEAVRRVLILLLIAGPAALIAAGLVGSRVLRSALLPVQRMTEKAEAIGIDRLDGRLSAPNPNDEIGRLAATLNAMLDRLQAGVGAKRQLIADASHELRTPLAAMRAELDISLRDGPTTTAERALIESLREDADSMSRTVDNLLQLAQADEGRLELVRTRVDLERVTEAATRRLQALAEAKGLTLRTSTESCEAAHADAQRLQHALTNMIENAIKYTPAGGEITVSCWHDGGEVGFTVADNGAGVPAEAHERLFDRFYRADQSRSRASGGAGLGLAICYEIATAHGGRVWVDSVEGEGSSFSIALPAYDPDTPTPSGSAIRTQSRPARLAS